MKRKSLSKACKHTILAVPAAALMLGASQGATVGINYTMNWGPLNPTGSYYNAYGTIAYGYQTTGMNVTATAFGVPAANWTNAQMTYYQKVNLTNVIGSLTIVSKANNGWSIYGPNGNGLGNTNTLAYGAALSQPAIVIPGNDQVTWAYLDDDVRTASSSPVYRLWSVQISGLRTAYPGGYTLQTIADPLNAPSPNVNLTDYTTFTNALVYTSIPGPGPSPSFCDTAISAVSPVMTNDSITIFPDPPVGNKTTGSSSIHHSTLAGFIIADAGSSSTPLTLSISGNNVVWTNGTLQSSATLGTSASWTNVPGATSPYPILPASAPQKYYRLKQ